MNNKLIYTQPATQWTHAMAIGNGHLGGMVFGDPKCERIALNHDEIWSGYPHDTTIPGAAETYQQIVALTQQNKLIEAYELAREVQCERCAAYLPLGDLHIDFNNDAPVEHYKRGLDLSTATSFVEYTQGGVQYKREYFASHPANVIAIKMTASAPFCCKVSLASPLKVEFDSHQDDRFILSMRGEAPGEFPEGGEYTYHEVPEKRGVQFMAAIQAVSDGEIVCKASSLYIENATECVLLFACETSFNGYDKHPLLEGKPFEPIAGLNLNAAQSQGYDALRKAHVEDYQQLYNRVALQLDDDGPDLPTDMRLEAHANGQTDNDLCVLLYNFGRYLAIAGSRPGTQPMNLQGIWNDLKAPPWRSNYTTNINTEMNYWPMLACSMPELSEPLIQMVRELSQAGEHTAKVHYNAPGFCAHHNQDLWRSSTPSPGEPVWSFFPLCGAWLSRELWEIYRHNQDRDFLANTTYPIIRKAAQFILHLLIEDENGNLIFPAATSPENFFLVDGQKGAIAKTGTMAMGIAQDMFEILIKCFDLLDVNDEFSQAVRQALPKLAPFKIGSKGQLLEWDCEHEEADQWHRHISHLYALHPARLIDIDRTPELAEACRKTLELRGDDGTGWSLGWKISFWARLREGDRALALLDMQLRPVDTPNVEHNTWTGGTCTNLFGTHPPFQIDGNFGLVAGVNEMLLQAPDDNTLHLLPALPARWPNGSIKGLGAPGNRKVDITWQDGKVTDYKIYGDTENLIIIGG